MKEYESSIRLILETIFNVNRMLIAINTRAILVTINAQVFSSGKQVKIESRDRKTRKIMTVFIKTNCNFNTETYLQELI